MERQSFEKKVYIVGAGPGDAGLMTVKGQKLLEEADTVIYDALAGDGILGQIPDAAKQIYVGKRSGLHSSSQEEIIRILLEEGKKGRLVVRLKGGDPFVFGRGGEEAKALRENQIPFEMVPGVTSAIAAPAYGGIPVTHRGTASSFHVITGHARAGKENKIDFEALVRVGGTLIFLMGVHAADNICNGLISAGMPEETPAAFIQEATTAGQKKVISTIGKLTQDGKRVGIRTPAVIVVGEVCALADVCSWSETRDLAGRKILVTRPRRRSSGLTVGLRAAGAEVVEYPTAEILPEEDSGPLLKVLERLREYGWLVLTSPSGAEVFFEKLREFQIDIRSLSAIKIAVIGSATAGILTKRGIYPDYMPERYYAEELGKGLSERAAGEKVLILRARNGSPKLVQPLTRAGIMFDDIVLYNTVYPDGNARNGRVKELLGSGAFDYVTFTSASTVRGFIKTLRLGEKELAGFIAVCIGEETKKAASGYGMNCIVSEIPTMDSMIEKMKKNSQTML